MKNKTLWVRIFLGALVLAALVAGSFTVYRVGYARGVAAAQSVSGETGKVIPGWRNLPAQNPHLSIQSLPGKKGRAHDNFAFPYQNDRGRFGGFSLLGGLLRLTVLGLIAWLVYKFFRGVSGGMGWQLTFQRISPVSEPEAPQPPVDGGASS